MNAEQLTTTIAEPYRRLSEFGYDFSNGLLLAWLSSGPIVQLQYDLETDEGADNWTFWWISGGRQNYPGIRNEIDRNILQTLHLNHLQASRLSENLPLTPLLSLIHRHRQDLVQLIDVKAAGGVDQLWRWWLSCGRPASFPSEEWAMAAELQAIHRQDISEFRKTGIAKPTALVMLSAVGKPYTATAAESALLWEAFLSSEAKMFGLPSRGLPFIPESPEISDEAKQTPLPPSLTIIAMSRPDLQAAFGSIEDSLSDLVYWWITVGRKEYAGLREEINRDLLRSLHIDHLSREDIRGGFALTPLLTVIRDRRPDLRRLFENNDNGILTLWRWWFEGGRAELFGQIDWLIDAEIRSLHQLDMGLFDQTGAVPLTTLVHAISRNPIDRLRRPTTEQISAGWRDFFRRNDATLKLPNNGTPYISNAFPDRVSGKTSASIEIFWEIFGAIYTAHPDLQKIFDWRTENGLAEMTFWWLDYGRRAYPELQQVIDNRILHALHTRCFSVHLNKEKNQLTPLLSILWGRRDDLRKAFDVTKAEGMAGMWRWWSESGRAELFGQIDWLIDRELQFLHRPEAITLEQAVEFSEINPVFSRAVSDTPRICLVGYPRGEFGLGEDVRLLRAALAQAKISNTVINAPWPISARQSIDEPSVDAGTANFDCDVMFYVMPPFDTVTLLTKMGVSAFSARRKIGFWQWELGRFPAQAKLAMQLVDEIWCHSEHTAKAFRAVTDKPVVKVPLPVFVPQPRLVPRTSFGLPTDAFLVFTSFDGASAIARKNPLAAILSFQEAFPRGGIEACLIVKAMNTQNDSLWRECLRKASIDERIVIIDDVIDRSAYFELLRNCDAVLSLHRAEGFGRLMAEAMALGIPVIASRYSGNLDFMTDDNSWLIKGDIIPVLRGDYAFYQDQEWFEPNVADAAYALQNCAANAAIREERAAAGKKGIEASYSLEACGRKYLELLGMNSSDRSTVAG